jgi:hypothetical protein
MDSDEAVDRGTRIFRLLILHHHFLYYQGADRFLWVCSIVSLSGAPADDAEAISFHLTKATLDTAAAHGFPNSRALEWELRALDSEAPAVASELRVFGCTAFHYASRWVLLWFADEHGLPGILAIWDNIVCAVGRDARGLRQYLLALAHVAAVPIPRDGVSMLEAIQQHRDWNVAEILARAGRRKNYCLWEHRYRLLCAVIFGLALYLLGRGLLERTP